MNITVVIPALDAASTLARQLGALHRQRFDVAFEVIVVDNGSVDATASVASGFDAPDFPVRVVTEPKRGINSARNAGIAAAKPGTVLLCDADDEVHHGWVLALASAVDDEHWAGGRLDYCGLNTLDTREIWNAPDLSAHRVTDPYIDNTYGCTCGFSTAMWARLGGFDVNLSGTGGDENEMFMRAYAAGFRMRWASEATVSYRLKPGVAGMMRQRFRQGHNQARWERLPGGAHLRGSLRPSRSLARLGKLVLVAPWHMLPRARRCEWLAAVSRDLGRLVGWWKHRKWYPRTPAA